MPGPIDWLSPVEAEANYWLELATQAISFAFT